MTAGRRRVTVQQLRVLLICLGVFKVSLNLTSSLWKPSSDDNQTAASSPRMLRHLTNVIGFGGEPDEEDMPLPHCGGDCDMDEECQESMWCWQRNVGDGVPGCILDDPSSSQTDYCVRESDAVLAEAAEYTPSPTFDDEKLTTPISAARRTTAPTTAAPTSSLPTHLPTAKPTFEPTGTPTLRQTTTSTETPTYDDETIAYTDSFMLTFDPTETTIATPTSGPTNADTTSTPTPSPTEATTASPTLGPAEAIAAPPTASPTAKATTSDPTETATGTPTSGPSYADVASPSPTETTTASPTFLAPTTAPSTASPTATSTTPIQNAVGFDPSAAPTFQFKGPPVSLAPTTESWGFLVNHSEPVPLIYVGNNWVFQAPYPLGPCQSDCDRDEDCFGQLICLQREGGEPVPGCLGEDPTQSDYCVFPEDLLEEEPTQPWQNGFRLKLYWEEGYRWQNETIERRWCITRNYTGSPITGNCWYGEQSLPCNATEMYIDKCSKDDNPDPKQVFDFVPVSEDEVLIQAYEEDRCWQRTKRNITLEACNATNHRQRWWAVEGGFNEEKFELSQKLQPKYCVNQDHHPKPGEVMKMYLCDKIRHPTHETSFWNLF